MNTLGGRLTLAIVAVLAITLVAFSTLLYAAVRSTLISQLDDRLHDEARALANMVEERAPGTPWELEVTGFAEHNRHADFGLYELRMDDGEVLTRSAGLEANGLPREGPATVTLPDGSTRRVIVDRHPPRLDEASPRVASGRLLSIAVARSTAPVEQQLSRLLQLLLLGGSVVLVAAAVVSRFAVARGLRPVSQLTARIDAIDDRTLSQRLTADTLPVELVPVVTRLNGLLARLDESFGRERRFSADVSHELRTPLAGLRSILEVTATRDRPPAEYKTALAEALAVVHQMVALVETLLTLEAREPAGAAAPIRVRPLVDGILNALAAVQAERRITIDNAVDPHAELPLDPGRLQLVLTNLLGNACTHSAEGAQVRVTSDLAHGIWLAVSNSGPAIPEAALPRIFDRFYRGDASRTGGGRHFGLGLSVVRAVCEQLGLSVRAENRADGWVVFTVHS